MDESRSDELLWELTRVAADDPQDEVPATELLQGYREGTLDEESRAALERLLADSAPARRRLAELGGVPSASEPRVSSQRVTGGRGLFAALAAGLVVAAGAYFLTAGLFAPPAAVESIAELRYEVSLTGLAEVRSSGRAAVAEPAVAQAYPETVVRLRIEPLDRAVSGVDFGIYRVAENELVRIPAVPPVEMNVVRGSAELIAPADALVGALPGRYDVYVAVFPAGARVDRVPLDAGVDSGADAGPALRARGAAFVDRRPIEILLDESGEE